LIVADFFEGNISSDVADAGLDAEAGFLLMLIFIDADDYFSAADDIDVTFCD